MKRTICVTTMSLLLLAVLCPATARAQQAETPKLEPAGQTEGQAPAEGTGESAGEKTGQDDADGEQPGPTDGNQSGGQPQNPMWIWVIMIGGFVVLYFFMGRSRRKQQKQRQEMIAQLKKGDRVVTIGGVVGTVTEARDDEIMVKVDDSTRMKFARWAIRNVGDEAREEAKKDTNDQQS